MTDTNNTNSIKISTATLRTLIRAVASAASADKTRSHIAQVRVMVSDGKIIADATDGHRLHRASAPWTNTDAPDVALPEPVGIPQASLAAVLKAVPALKRGQKAGIATLTSTSLETETAAVRWTATEIARFPDADRVIPQIKDDRTTHASSYGIHPPYLVDAMESCHVLDGPGAIVHTPESSVDPIRIDAKSNDGMEVVCVVMPKRMM